MPLFEGPAERQRIVVIGGGIAGAIVAKILQNYATVFLIDPKEYFEIPWTWPRSIVEPSFAERTVINHKDYLQNVTLVLSSAINITDNGVRTSEGRFIAFDFLIIATGHTYSAPITRMEKLAQFREENEKINSANSILIIGGGPTGVEVAGELATDFPNKKVTIVHRGSRLMEFIGPKASSKTLNWLTSKRVDVLLRQTVNVDEKTEEGAYVTSSGETIAADCHFVCTGSKVGSSWLTETILKNCVDSNGRLMVDENLRVKSYKNIFAVGDITDIPEIKQGFYAEKHAHVVAKNIKTLLKGRPEEMFDAYKPGKVIAMISLGRKEAVAQFPFGSMIGCIPGMIKSKDLFVGKTRKQLGL